MSSTKFPELHAIKSLNLNHLFKHSKSQLFKNIQSNLDTKHARQVLWHAEQEH